MPEKTNSDELYLKDATNLQTEPIPGGHKLSDGSGITTEDIPKVKTPEEQSDNEED